MYAYISMCKCIRVRRIRTIRSAKDPIGEGSERYDRVRKRNRIRIFAYVLCVWYASGVNDEDEGVQTKQEWVYEIFEKCEKADVKFFFKQWGGTNKKKTGRTLNGRTYDEMPEVEVTF